jgi:hypothetical protein
MFVTEGVVVEILEHGFRLDCGTEVATQTPGRKLGLRRGDRVRVKGGSGGGDTFLSSSAWKFALFGRLSLRVPVNEHERRSWLWWL